jgi:hypothetical protein
MYQTDHLVILAILAVTTTALAYLLIDSAQIKTPRNFKFQLTTTAAALAYSITDLTELLRIAHNRI